MFKLAESNLQYVTSITFLLTTYAKYMSASKYTFNCGNVRVTSSSLRNLAKQQACASFFILSIISKFLKFYFVFVKLIIYKMLLQPQGATKLV